MYLHGVNVKRYKCRPGLICLLYYPVAPDRISMEDRSDKPYISPSFVVVVRVFNCSIDSAKHFIYKIFARGLIDMRVAYISKAETDRRKKFLYYSSVSILSSFSREFM